MTTTDDIEARKQPRRAALSSYFGTMLEGYDFFLYATAAALVFNQVFFSNLDPLVGTIVSFATLATGYLARPVGAVLFGHFGDRVGRKTVLIWTMVLMAGASTLIGLLPTYDQIGVVAPILLVTLRMLQGVSLGGEWGGAVLLSSEHSRDGKRGLWASFTQAGGPSGMGVSTLVMAVTSALTTQEQFLSWGWRVPFLLSVVLLVVGLVIRMKVNESPVFLANASRTAPKRTPLASLFREDRRNLLLVIGVCVGSSVGAAMLSTFVVTYATSAGHEQQNVLNTLTVAMLSTIVSIPVFGQLSDRVGRRPVMIAGATGLMVVAFVLFPIIDTGSALLLALTLPLTMALVHSALAAPLAALAAEQFATGHRYTGASVAFQFAGVFGGLTPMTFALILQANQGQSTLALSLTFAGVCVVTILCALFLTERRGQSLQSASVHTESPIEKQL